MDDWSHRDEEPPQHIERWCEQCEVMRAAAEADTEVVLMLD